MKWSAPARIALGLVVVTICVLLLGDLAGLTPGRTSADLEARKQLVETLAVHVARDSQRGDYAAIQQTMDLLRRRNPSVLSIALRSAQGAILVQSGDHASEWVEPPEGHSTPDHAQVPILRDTEMWGEVEVSFEPLTRSGLRALWHHPLGRLLAFVSAIGFVAYLVYLRRTLRYLDPSSVIPTRVQAVLDTLAEGVILVDGAERIVLANAAFQRHVGSHAVALLGRKASELGWTDREGRGVPRRGLPWVRSLQSGTAEADTAVVFAQAEGGARTFHVNSAPIVDEEGRRRGALASFDDVTELEKTSAELRKTLDELVKSREEIRFQNDELRVLATRDPLTGCLNRRSFLERFEADCAKAAGGRLALHCIMADIDHFKRVNDVHGHGVGDRVIQVVAETLTSLLGPSDAIARWGGEEFCVLVTNRPWDEAGALAELARRRIAAIDLAAAGLPPELRITASFGLATYADAPGRPLELVDRADRALYESKNQGRDRVTFYRSGL